MLKSQQSEEDAEVVVVVEVEAADEEVSPNRGTKEVQDILICLPEIFHSVECIQNRGKEHISVQIRQAVPGKMSLSRNQQNNEKSTSSVK